MTDIATNKPIFPISVIAKMIGTCHRTLRIYDEEGILIPSRSEGNRRLYSMDDLQRGKLIQYLTRELGVNLAGIKLLLGIDILRKGKGNSDNTFSEITLKDIVTLSANIMNITPEVQAENRIKLSRRGRKSSKIEG